MDLRFGGACADGDPAEQVVKVAGGHGLQQFSGDGQAQAQHFTHQLARERQATDHVVTAVQTGVIGQAFPADRGAGFFDVGAHHDEHFTADVGGESGELFSVFEG
ncbi:hypothetical protein D3C73_1269630 [compost metagenome]